MSFQNKILSRLLELRIYSLMRRLLSLHQRLKCTIRIRDSHISRENDNSWITSVRVAHRLQINLEVSAGLFVQDDQDERSKLKNRARSVFSYSHSAFFGHFLLTEELSNVREREREGGSFFVCIESRGSHCRYTRLLNNGTIIPIVTGVTQELRRL